MVKMRNCFIGSILLGIIWFCSWTGGDEKVPNIKFSVESGFYDEEFFLEIQSGEGTVYYTLDSSEPNENSKIYDTPILISDASKNNNVYSLRTDVSPDFMRESLEKLGISGTYEDYLIPNKCIDKTNIVRAVCIDEKGNRSDIITGVYFVGYQNKKGYKGMNFISVVTDPKDLFDYDSGIYVTGKIFNKSISEKNKFWANYKFLYANYTQKGIQWEKLSNIHFFDSEKNLVLSDTFGIRIQGGGSRSMLPKSLNLFARDRYGTDRISGNLLFSLPGYFDSVNLYSGGNSMKTMLNDYLVNCMAADLNVAVRKFEPYVLFLDGEYWGVFWLTQRYETEYFENIFGVYGDDIVEIKCGAVEVGTDADLGLYTSMVEDIADCDMSNPDEYEKACELVDIESCIDYYAAEIYIANSDWANNNFALWRSRDVSGGKYSNGKWRWILYDVNLSMAPTDAEADYIKFAANRDPLFASLLDSEEFTAALHKKLVELADNNFNPYRIETFVNDYEVRMSDVMEKYYERFYGDNRTIQDFYSGCEDIKQFFQRRYIYIKNTYGEEQ